MPQLRDKVHDKAHVAVKGLNQPFSARSDKVMGNGFSKALRGSLQFADVTGAGLGTKTYTPTHIWAQRDHLPGDRVDYGELGGTV